MYVGSSPTTTTNRSVDTEHIKNINMNREQLIELAAKYKQSTNNKDFENILHLMVDFYLFMTARQRSCPSGVKSEK